MSLALQPSKSLTFSLLYTSHIIVKEPIHPYFKNLLTNLVIYFDSTKISRETKLIWCSKLNPNGRSPVVIDHVQINRIVWESNAVLTFLVQMYDMENTSWPQSVFDQSHVNNG